MGFEREHFSEVFQATVNCIARAFDDADLSFVILPGRFVDVLEQVEFDKTAREFIDVIAVGGTQRG
jgi:hypothetical protein